jgi:hypothetical protein
VALNFGTAGSPEVIVFYGGNDGVLRAANGNRATAIASKAAGSELWSFVAPEFYTQIKRLRDNSTPINFTDRPRRLRFVLPNPMVSTDHHGLPGREQCLVVREHAPRRQDPVRLQRHGNGHNAGKYLVDVEDRLPQPGRRYRLHDQLHWSRPDLVGATENQDQRL